MVIVGGSTQATALCVIGPYLKEECNVVRAAPLGLDQLNLWQTSASRR
jgi:hypothetical protein